VLVVGQAKQVTALKTTVRQPVIGPSPKGRRSICDKAQESVAYILFEELMIN
jgi:hypothetical protein